MLRAADSSMSFAKCDWCFVGLTVGEERMGGRKCMSCRRSQTLDRLFVTAVTVGTDEVIYVSTVGPELLFPDRPLAHSLTPR